MSTQYNVDYFIQKFEAIPEPWAIGTFEDELGRKCALGHCCEAEAPTEEGAALRALFKKAGMAVGWVNDGPHFNYQQTTPKQRILAALRDIKAKQV